MITGCEKLVVTDGIWKLNYPVCMFKVPVKVENVQLNLPDCCPNQPIHGKPFCKQHTQQLIEAGVPDDLVGFLGHAKQLLQEDEHFLIGNCNCV